MNGQHNKKEGILFRHLFCFRKHDIMLLTTFVLQKTTRMEWRCLQGSRCCLSRRNPLL